jgi:hypothetical protein
MIKALKKRDPHFTFIVLISLMLGACTVTFITGYDQVIDSTATKIKSDFNKHFIKLVRTLQDSNPDNQKFENFQEYYDNMEVDLIILKDRTKFLEGRSEVVKKQIITLDSVMSAFENLHKHGLKDNPADDRRDIRNGINSAIDGVIRLQEELKSTGKTK